MFPSFSLPQIKFNDDSKDLLHSLLYFQTSLWSGMVERLRAVFSNYGPNCDSLFNATLLY